MSSPIEEWVIAHPCVRMRVHDFVVAWNLHKEDRDIEMAMMMLLRTIIDAPEIGPERVEDKMKVIIRRAEAFGKWFGDLDTVAVEAEDVSRDAWWAGLEWSDRNEK